MSEARIDEIADGVYRIATFDPQVKLPFCEFLVTGDEPLLVHAGHRSRFAQTRDAVARVLPPERLRWLAFSHLEADESGAMNEWLAVAPAATVAHGRLGAMVSLLDLADRPPRALDDGDVLDLGGKRVRWLATPHVPHGWDAGLLFEETTGTLFVSDLLASVGDAPPSIANGDALIDGSLQLEDALHASALTPATAPTIRRLADLAPRLVAPMHASAFAGDTAATLRVLADAFEDRLRRAVAG